MKNEISDQEITEAVFTFHRNIKYLREKAGLSTKQLADIIGASEETLILAESCTEINCLHDLHLKNICRYFKTGADELFYEKLY